MPDIRDDIFFLNLLLYKLSLTGDTRSIDIIFSDDFKFWRYTRVHKEKKKLFSPREISPHKKSDI